MPKIRVSSIICSSVFSYLHSLARRRPFSMNALTLSPLSYLSDLSLYRTILKLLFGPTYLSNHSQYTDNVFDSVLDRSQVLAISFSSSPDQSRRYFAFTIFVFSASGPSNMNWRKALHLCSACGASVDPQFIVGGDKATTSAMFGYDCSMFVSVGSFSYCACREPPLFTYEAVWRDVIRSVRCQRVHRGKSCHFDASFLLLFDRRGLNEYFVSLCRRCLSALTP